MTETNQLGMVGLGRMGANMVDRLAEGGHRCVVFDVDTAAVEEMERRGHQGARTLAELTSALARPRTVWLMIPTAHVAGTVEALLPLLDAGDVIIDGGNSWYREAIAHAEDAGRAGVHFVDVGTSGGVHGRERGYCLMAGGDDEAIDRLAPIFDTLAPGVAAADRTPGRDGPPATEEKGWMHCGPAGAGHFVKMVHNGIEYGMMAAYAEGLNVLAKADVGLIPPTADAETAPLHAARYYEYDFDLARITELWRRGSVVASWLLDLTAEELLRDPDLDTFQGNVSDSGEGRWTIDAAIDEGVPVPVLSAALFQRFSSRGRSDVADKVLSAMRSAFGGHAEKEGDE